MLIPFSFPYLVANTLSGKIVLRQKVINSEYFLSGFHSTKTSTIVSLQFINKIYFKSIVLWSHDQSYISRVHMGFPGLFSDMRYFNKH